MLSKKLFLTSGFFSLGAILFQPLFSNEIYAENINPTIKMNANNDVNLEVQTSGKEIYNDFCIQCHGANGKGDGLNFPPLAGSDWLRTKRAQSIAAVKFGQSGEIVVNEIKYNNTMPAMGLSHQEITDVMNYIMTSWGNQQSTIVTEKEVESIQK